MKWPVKIRIRPEAIAFAGDKKVIEEIAGSDKQCLEYSKAIFNRLCAVAEVKLGITKSQIESNTRKRPIAICRQAIGAMTYIYGVGVQETAAKATGLDRSTIYYYIDQLEKAIDGYDPKLFSIYITIKDEFFKTVEQDIDKIYQLNKFIDYYYSNKNLPFNTILAQYLKELNYEIAKNKTAELCEV